MERIEVLINKLKEQLQQKASPGQMLVTVQLLHSELIQHQAHPGKQFLGTSKVAVVLPQRANAPAYSSEEFEKFAPKTEAHPVVEESTASYEVSKLHAGKNKSPYKKQEQENLLFDPLLEIPTLSHQAGVKEINDTAGKQESLNDKLKQQNAELGEKLKDSPVRDLRKAIGINDRFVFINDLFRGDEVMYERSIKTINSFHILAEAEYWINRELIIKLGWDQDHEIVRGFYQLVRRRFS
jgi:hypothetical protein